MHTMYYPACSRKQDHKSPFQRGQEEDLCNSVGGAADFLWRAIPEI